MSSTIDPALAREFNFDAADVAANREGRLTPDQQIMFANVAGRGRHRTKVMLASFVVLVVAAVVAALVAADTEITPGLVALIVGIAMVPMIGVTVVSRSFGKNLESFENPRVASVDGRATWQSAMSEGVHLFVGDITFTVFGDQASLFQPERTYRVHYLVTGASTQSVLSVEVID